VRWSGRVLSEAAPEGHQPACNLSNPMVWQTAPLDSVGPKPDNIIYYFFVIGVDRGEETGWKNNGIVLKRESSEDSSLSRLTMRNVNLMEALG
jgi:hypothetical protein